MKLLLLTRIASMLLALATSQLCALAADETKGQASAENQPAKALKARVLHLDSNNKTGPARLVRPSLPKITPDAGNAPEHKDFLLRSKVLHAAGFHAQSGRKDARTPYDNFKLNSEELKTLGAFDISVLIDCSGSMSRQDCVSIKSFLIPERISRWLWCKEQTTLLAEQISSAFPTGITVVPFSSRAWRFDDVHPSKISEVFEASTPRGSTRLDAALALELNHYFQERQDKGEKALKPLLIAVITDGVPSRPDIVLRDLARVTNLIGQNKIRVVFFLIGNAAGGMDFMHTAKNLREFGGKYELAEGYSFSQLEEQGLPRSLLKSVKDMDTDSR